ncbi:MAG: hypothetical protein ACT4OF_12745 [Caulobacteraceae bacterium]
MMTEAVQVKPATPWHLWVVGIVGILWNAYGCYDYVMTNTGGVEYLRAFGFTEEQIAYYTDMPAWMTAVWAIGVWGGVLGAVLLLLRMKWALHVFVASLAAFVFSLVYTYALSNGAEVMPPESIYINAVILIGCLFFVWYAWFASKRGLLR